MQRSVILIQIFLRKFSKNLNKVPSNKPKRHNSHILTTKSELEWRCWCPYFKSLIRRTGRRRRRNQLQTARAVTIEYTLPRPINQRQASPTCWAPYHNNLRARVRYGSFILLSSRSVLEKARACLLLLVESKILSFHILLLWGCARGAYIMYLSLRHYGWFLCIGVRVLWIRAVFMCRRMIFWMHGAYDFKKNDWKCSLWDEKSDFIFFLALKVVLIIIIFESKW